MSRHLRYRLENGDCGTVFEDDELCIIIARDEFHHVGIGRNPPVRIDASSAVQPLPDMESYLSSVSYSQLSAIGEARLPPGTYYPRMWRQHDGPLGVDRFPGESRQLLRILSNFNVYLQEIFRVVEPQPTNDAVYGHRIRDILLLACMEVESAWRSVLLANGVLPSARGFTTKDYVRLLGPMKLADWEVRLAHTPEYPPLRPFATWDSSAPTKSLSWYDAYNAAKHDRERNFSSAQLSHMISAVAGVVVMFAAQFGPPELDPDQGGVSASPFSFCRTPVWDPEEQYIPPGRLPKTPSNWTSTPFPFA